MTKSFLQLLQARTSSSTRRDPKENSKESSSKFIEHRKKPLENKAFFPLGYYLLQMSRKLWAQNYLLHISFCICNTITELAEGSPPSKCCRRHSFKAMATMYRRNLSQPMGQMLFYFFVAVRTLPPASVLKSCKSLCQYSGLAWNKFCSYELNRCGGKRVTEQSFLKNETNVCKMYQNWVLFYGTNSIHRKKLRTKRIYVCVLKLDC